MPNIYKALIVEDNLSWLEIFQTAIEKSENNFFEFIHAPDLATALLKVKTESIQLILLDLLLPDSSGPIHTIKEMTDVVKFIPIIIISTLDDDKLIQEAFTYGIEDYLVKDQYNEDTFFHVTQQAIRRCIAKASKSIEQRLEILVTRLNEIDQRLVQVMTKQAAMTSISLEPPI